MNIAAVFAATLGFVCLDYKRNRNIQQENFTFSHTQPRLATKKKNQPSICSFFTAARTPENILLILNDRLTKFAQAAGGCEPA